MLTLGGASVAGAVAWVGQVSLASWAWPVRVFPPLGMFLLGLALILWAARGDHSRRAVLKRAIQDGRAILSRGRERFHATMYLGWRNKTADALQEHVGTMECHDFDMAGHRGGGLYEVMTAQVGHLEGLRKRRWRKRR